MKKLGNFIFVVMFLLSGCGRDEVPETVGMTGGISSAAQSAVVSTALEISVDTEVITYGEKSDFEPMFMTSLETLLSITENCESVSDLRKALGNSSDLLEDLASLCREAGGETALLAVRTLVQIGTPAATLELISLISDLSNGRFKADVLYEAEQLNAPEAVPVLLEVLRVAGDDDVLRFSQQVLSRLADADLITQLQQEYQLAETADQRNTLAETLRYIETETAVEPLIELMISSEILSDPLALAAVDALGTIGSDDAVLALFQTLEKTTDQGDAEILMRSIRRISNGDALSVIKQVEQSSDVDSLSYVSFAQRVIEELVEK